MQTKQQERAAFALENLPFNENGKIDKETANFIVGTPTMILTNGLGQTLAFLLSNKDKPKQYKVFAAIKRWLCLEMKDQFGNAQQLADFDFIGKFNAIDQREYLQAQQESLRMLEWLKRYARAFQEEKK
jgi:CRISPR-associated protein Cmr5